MDCRPSTRHSCLVSPQRGADPETIAVIGAGAVGCMLAAHLAGGGHHVLLCSRSPLSQVAMTLDGETVKHNVAWAGMPAEFAPMRFAVLATKIHQTLGVAGWLGALPSGAILLAAQNGVDHSARLSSLTAAAVVPAVVYPNAERTGPGQVLVRRTGRGLLVPDDEAGRAVVELFAGCGLSVEAAADFSSAAWKKLMVNIVSNPLTALTGRRAEVLHEPAIAALGLGLALEVAAVARAEGASLTDVEAAEVLPFLQGLPLTTPSSMLQDRLAGREMEHQGLLGPVVTLGTRHGVPTPLARAVLALLEAAHSRPVASA